MKNYNSESSQNGNNMKNYFNIIKLFLGVALMLAFIAYGDSEMATSDPSNEFMINAGIENQPFFLREVEPIYYSGKFQTYDESQANTLRVTVTTDGETTILKETIPSDDGFIELRPADYTIGYHLLKHEILNVSGNVISSMQKGFTVLDYDKVELHTDDISQNETWSSNKVHIVWQSLTISSGRTLTIKPGTIVKFCTGAGITITSGAHCIANSVIFTHINDDSAGGDTLGDGVTNSPMDAYFIEGDITYDDNTEFRFLTHLEELVGTISGNVKLNRNKTYCVSGILTIASGGTLTIPPGTVLKMDSGASISVSNGGTIKAIGSRSAPIVITSIKDDTYNGDTNGDGGKTYPAYNDWKYITVSGTVNFKYVSIYYGGGVSNSSESGMLIANSGGKISLDCCTLAHALFDGIFSYGTVTAENTIIYDCDRGVNTSGGSGVFKNCVVDYCRWGVMAEGGNGTYYNCIITRFFGSPTWPTGWGVAYWSGSLSTYNCCVWSTLDGSSNYRSAPTIVDNISANPLYYDPDNGDFRISEDSPCVDRGKSDVAPEYDYYGHPRMTITSRYDGGKPLADIGIYEALSDDVISEIDLVPVSISSETNATPGQTISLELTIKNNGRREINESWRDTISLVSGYGQEISLGDFINTSKISSGETISYSVTFTVPTISEGTWFPKVNLNSYHDVFEGIYSTNNALVGNKELKIALETLDANVSHEGIIKSGTPTILKLSFGETNENRMVRFIVPVGVKISWGFGFMPQNSACSGSIISDGSDVAFYVPVGATDVFIVLESENETSYKQYTENSSLSIISVSPTSLPSSGKTTLTIKGAGFGVTNKVTLSSSASIYQVNDVDFDIEGNLIAHIDCSNFSSGKTYSIKVESESGIAELSNAVSILNEAGKGELELDYTIPTTARPGRTFSIAISYKNTGNIDICPPLLTVADSREEAKNPVEFSLDGNTYVTGTIQFLGTDAQERFEDLHPGEEATLRVLAKIPPSNSGTPSISVRMNTVSDSMSQYTTELDRYITPALRREYENSTNTELRSEIERLYNAFGENNGEMIRNFATTAKLFYYSTGIVLQRINDLIVYAEETFNEDTELQNEDFELTDNSFINGNDKATGAYLWPDLIYLPSNPSESSYDFHNDEVVVISHGLNDGLWKSKSTWMSRMAAELSAKGKKVICINWEKEADLWTNYKKKITAFDVYDMWLVAVSDNISDVAATVNQQLRACKIDPANTTFIGHSFGSHLLGYIARTLKINNKKIKRHIGLDTAAISAVNNVFRARVDDADITEYYRSSSGSGRDDAYAKYNYIVHKATTFDFISPKDIFNPFIANHSYSHEWMIDNIRSGSFSDIGFWRKDSDKGGKMLPQNGYIGIIYGPGQRLEAIYPYLEGKDKSKISYPGNQSGWFNTVNEYGRTYDLSFESTPSFEGGNNVFYTEVRKRVRFSIKDRCINDIMIDRNQLYYFVGINIRDIDNENIVNISSVKQSNNIFDFDIQVPDSIIPNGKEEIEKNIILRIVPLMNAPGNNMERELYSGDNTYSFKTTIKRGNVPIAAIRVSDPPKNSQFTDFEITKKIHYKSQKEYNKAIERGDTFTVNFNGNGSKVRDGREIAAYQWYIYELKMDGETGPVFKREFSKLYDQTYLITLQVTDDLGRSSFRTCKYNIRLDFGEGEPVEQATSWDPNEISGPLGLGNPATERFVKPGDWLTYTIFFENKTNATASAQEVYVTNPLSEYLDWNTFEIEDIVYNNQVDLGLSGKQNGSIETTINGTNYSVRTNLELDKTNGVVKCYMRIVDPDTETGWPEDVYAGFLPPNNEEHCGEGHITYRIKVRDDAPAKVKINNSATIVFDYNDPIETDPSWWNTVAQLTTISFDNGDEDVTLIVGLPYGELPKLEGREGWTFAGWFTGPNGSGRQITEDSLVEEGDEKLYAYWTANSFKVNYNSNGGEGEMASQFVTYGTIFSLSSNTFTRTSFKFAGWGTNETSAVIYVDGATVSNLTSEADGSVDLFAMWSLFAVQITIDVDGVETNLNLVVGQAYGELPKPADREGMTFVGWFTGPDGTGRQITKDSLVEEGDKHLYAYWNVNSYTVNYNPNGGEGEMKSQTVDYGTEFNLTSNTFTRTNFVFGGWGTNETSEIIYIDGATVSNLTTEVDGRVDLFAVWKSINVQVTIEIDGVETNLNLIAGQAYGELPQPSERDGWTFVGWFTGPEGTGRQITKDSLVEEGDERLYAYWTANTYTVDYNPNGGEGEMESQTVDYGTEFSLTSNTFTRTNFTFGGWGTNETSEIIYIDGATVSNLTTEVDGRVDLFAVWKSINIQITIDIDGVETNLNLVVGQAYGKLPTPAERKGWIFVGWFTGPDGTGRLITEDSLVVEGDTALYQYWVRDWHDLNKDDETNAVSDTYDGYIYDVDTHDIKGSIKIKVGMPKNGSAKVTGTVILVGGTKSDIMATMIMSDTKIDTKLKNGSPLKLILSSNGMMGTLDKWEISGVRNLFLSKAPGDQAIAEVALNQMQGVYTVAWEEGAGYVFASIAIGKKGKAKATGCMANGTKFSATGQLLIGKEEHCVNLVSKSSKTPVGFNLWFAADKSLETEGTQGTSVAGKLGALGAHSFFTCDYLTEPIPVDVIGNKWSVTASKLLAFKLSYKDSAGSFKGSFKVGKEKATVNGVVVEGVGYGTAVTKSSGAKAVIIKEIN